MSNDKRVLEISHHGQALSVPVRIILGLTGIVIFLLLVILGLYLYGKQTRKRLLQLKIHSPAVKVRPKLRLTLPSIDLHTQIKSEKVVLDSALPKNDPRENSGVTDFVIPPSPVVPITPETPYLMEEQPHLLFQRSISADVQSREQDTSELAKSAIKRNFQQVLTTRPKREKKISYCANGKLKFLLKYEEVGKNELLVQVLDIIDLPVVRESGVTSPYLKVQLYPQAAHSYGALDELHHLWRTETLSYPKETSCSFVGCPVDRLKNLALMFTILEYNRFSKSEFVAECVVHLDEVSLTGEPISKHLSIRRTEQPRDMGSLSVMLCYQPASSRLCLSVLKAINLPTGEGGQAQDYYVKVTLLRHGLILDKRRTRLVKKTSAPVFNEPFSFPVDLHGIRSLELVCDVIRHDSKLKQEKVGNVILANNCDLRQVSPHEIQHFNEMIMSPQRQLADWHRLVDLT